MRTTPRTALVMGMLWCVSLGAFAVTGSYPMALGLLFVAGMCELAFSSIAMTVVQGLGGSAFGIHASLIGSTLTLLVVLGLLGYWIGRRTARRESI